jgi:hypothetical protein
VPLEDALPPWRMKPAARGAATTSTRGALRFAIERRFPNLFRDRHATSRLWGIKRGPWLWAPRVRILFVTDGRVNRSKELNTFGLGLVLDTLRDESFAWWVRIDIDVAKREGPGFVNPFPGSYGLKYSGFRFDQAGFDIDHYDQVWFFADGPGKDADGKVGDEIIHLLQNRPRRCRAEDRCGMDGP